jgi:DNA-binding MarR family transcriptional regulator
MSLGLGASGEILGGYLIASTRRSRLTECPANPAGALRRARHRESGARQRPGALPCCASHLHVFANMVGGGKRLTELADAASMSLPSMQELVDDLERRGIVNRQPDRRDGRAKLVVLTAKGLDALAPAGSIIEQLEREYADRIGDERFEDMCLALNTLIDNLLEGDDGRPE